MILTLFVLPSLHLSVLPLVYAAEQTAPVDISIQKLIDANPGKSIYLEKHEYRINEPIRINADGTKLIGDTTIIQTNSNEDIIKILGASDVQLRGLTLKRPVSDESTNGNGVLVEGANNFLLSGLTVLDNRSTGSAIFVESSTHGRIINCNVINYKRVGIDDRTSDDLYGYAFRAIVGDGIAVKSATHIEINGNRVVETNLISDAATKREHALGRLVKGERPVQKGRYAPKGDYAANWHQGSAILVTDPEKSLHILVNGNIIENAGQGIDIHADHVTISSNIVDHAFIGIKIMHGARNVIVTGNNVSHMDLWGLVMQPGAAARKGKSYPSHTDRPSNVTSGNIVVGNVFSDFGYGHDYHNWKDSNNRNVLQFEVGPLIDAPPLRQILVIGNIVHNPDLDSIKPETVPRFNYAVFLGPKVNVESILFLGNSFDSGSLGVSNVNLD